VVGAYTDDEHLERVRAEMVSLEAELVVVEGGEGPAPAE
jgi:hypothetical protein